jgi:hypothetical protein
VIIAYTDIGTLDLGPPESLDNVGVEYEHEDQREDVQEDGLEDAVDKTGVVTPVRDTVCEVPEDVFYNTRLELYHGDCREDSSFWQADDDGDAPDDDQKEDDSLLFVGKCREWLADGWEMLALCFFWTAAATAAAYLYICHEPQLSGSALIQTWTGSAKGKTDLVTLNHGL